MLHALNKKLEKLMPFITPSAVLIGVLFASSLSHLTFIVPWVFAFMTFSGSLSSNFHSVKKAVSFPVPLLTSLLILHILMPLWAFGMGSIVFPEDGLTVTGLLLAMVIPTGITSFVWVTIYKGNIGLALSIILVDTILSPFIVPASLSFIVGQKVEMDSWSIMNGLMWMVVIPSIIGMICNHVTKGTIKDTLGKRLSPFSKIGIGVVVAINSSAVAPYLKEFSPKLFMIAFTVLFIAVSGFALAWLLGTMLKQSRDTKTSLLFTGGMRNISAGAVIAVHYFPAAVAVPVVIGMLFQQVLASFFGFLFHRRELRMEGN
ncbi:bile acid:sodium symporter family protein [Rossellomorea aquimaris]|uniref:bile acid:sodium symporter family protein n=1 Tax=Rossellomorea aquimaris TaxID=189382 RepID=UPI001CD7F0F7|nr:bile acid:sodium symporter family protein [Rossellomorea aquimaris]MCA1055503.1 bile acid:sodium symporter family protein [Rossellomorea aquimaris]